MKEPNEGLAPEAPPGTPEANLSGPAKPEKSPLLRELRSLAVRLAVFAAVLWVLLTQVYLVTQASGSEMFPAVKDGDLVLGCRLEKDYAKNDVVVYERRYCSSTASWQGTGTPACPASSTRRPTICESSFFLRPFFKSR